MIVDECEISYENKEIEEKVTLPCPDEVTQNFICQKGELVNNLCISKVCPEGYIDNVVNCSKEVNGVLKGIVFRPFRIWTGYAYGSGFIIQRLENNASVDVNTIFTNFSRTGNITVELNNVVYTAKLSPNIVGNSQLDFDNGHDVFASIIPNSLFTYPTQIVLYEGGYPDRVIWNNQTYTKNVTLSCPEGSTANGDKCFKYVNKIDFQETPTIVEIVKKKIAKQQIVKVAKGETKSEKSQAHADFLAKQLLKQKISQLQPLCEDAPVYYNDYLTKTAKKDCTSGIPCDITVSVQANLFSSEISKEDANNKAKVELDRLFSLATPCCSQNPQNFLSEAKQFVFSKSCSSEKIIVDVSKGGNFNYRGIFVPIFDSTISVTDANNKRDSWFLTNKTLFENLISCPEQDCESSVIVKTTQKVLLKKLYGEYTITRFDSGSFIDDINELDIDVGDKSSYRTIYCTEIPTYTSYPEKIIDVSGAVITSLTKSTITYSYTTTGTPYENGEYYITFKLRSSSSLGSKTFKYGDEKCC